MKYDVFISYSREDYVDESKNVIPGNIVSQIKQFLTDNGYTYWFDEEGIYSGDAFVKVITEAIQDSEVFLFVSTQASNRSKWTNHEIATAKLLGKKTIPFRVDNSIYDKSILMYLAPLDYVDYANNPNIAFSKLLAALRNHFSKKQEEENRRLQEKEQEKTRELLVSVFRLLGKELPTESQEATNKPERKAEIHIKADANCTMLRFGTVLANLQANQDHVIHLMPGKHKFTFIATEDSSIKEERNYSLSPEILSDFIDIKIKQKIVNKIKREKEEKERQAEEELKRKEEEKKVKEEEEKNREEEKRIRTLTGHTDCVDSAAFSPDGKRIASTSTNILIWDIVKGKIIKKLEGHTDAVWSAAFSPDGKRIVSASMDQTTRIWDVETGECVKILKGNVHSAAFSPDGKRIVSAGKYEARIWNAETGESIKRFHRKIGALRHLSFSPDGSKIAIASELHCIYILDISNL